MELNVSESTENQAFEMLGFLSTMISRRFTELTAPSHNIERLIPDGDPDSLGVLIPFDYKGKQMPLWRFVIKPNYG
jgi:hypothetical protein